MQVTTVGSALSQGLLQALSVGMEVPGGAAGNAPSGQEFHAIPVS